MLCKSLAISIFACVIALSSCTVEKRRHLSGYHISWNNASKKVPFRKVERRDIKKKECGEISRGNRTLLKEIQTNSSLRKKNIQYNQSTSNLPIDDIPNNSENAKISISKAALVAHAKMKKDSTASIEEPDLHPNTVMGIFSAALSIPAVIGMIALFSGGIFSIILGILLFLIWLILVIFGFIFSIKAFTNTLEYPEEYKGPVWAALGIALSVASVILFFLLIGLI